MTAATFVKHVGIGGAKIGKLKGTEKKQVFNMTVKNRIYYKIIL